VRLNHHGIGSHISAISAAKRESLRSGLNGGCTRIHGKNACAGPVREPLERLVVIAERDVRLRQGSTR
jgi:hypothetical protein